MPDVTIIGGGLRARDCGEVLSRAGFSTARSFEIDASNRSPIILGELHGGFQVAREAMETGRHLLIAGTQVLTPERLALLLELRRQAQGIFIWSDRRHHPGYRLITGLMESDSTWRPRYLRQEVLSTEQASSAEFRWQALESIALLNSLTSEEPVSVSATAAINTKRNAPDVAQLAISYPEIEAQLTVGLGEAIERRETLMASATRKAYIDELNQEMPIRIVADEPSTSNNARRLSCAAPTAEELARQQCIAFLDSTLDAQLTVTEAGVWRAGLAVLAAMEQSFTNRRPADVVIRQEEPRFRVVGGGLRTFPPTVA